MYINKGSELKLRTYKYSLSIIKYLDKLPNKRIYWSISDQLMRSATSIGANIVEAQEAASKKEFYNFYRIAFKSAIETKYWLCLIRDGVKNDPASIAKLLSEADELSKMLGASLKTMKKK